MDHSIGEYGTIPANKIICAAIVKIVNIKNAQTYGN